MPFVIQNYFNGEGRPPAVSPSLSDPDAIAAPIAAGLQRSAGRAPFVPAPWLARPVPPAPAARPRGKQPPPAWLTAQTALWRRGCTAPRPPAAPVQFWMPDIVVRGW